MSSEKPANTAKDCMSSSRPFQVSFGAPPLTALQRLEAIRHQAVQRAELAVSANDWPAARDFLNFAVTAFPDDRDLRECLGVAHFHNEEFESAANALVSCIEKGRRDPVSLALLATAQHRTGRVNETLVTLDVILSLAPDDTASLTLKTQLLLQKEDYLQARRTFLCLLRVTKTTEAMLGLALCQEKLGEYEDSLNTYLQVLQQDAENPVALANLAILTKHLGSPEVQAAKEATFPLPVCLEIASTNVCNINPPCVQCWKHIDTAHGYLNRDSRHLPREYLLELSPAIALTKSVTLHGIGEPLTNPHLFEALEHVSEKTNAQFTSNGLLLNQKVIDTILSQPVHGIDFSLDAATAETYKKIRHNDFDRVVRQTKRLVECREERGLKHPRVYLNMCLMRENIKEVATMVRLARHIGADHVHIFHMNKGANYAYDWFNYAEQHYENDPETHDAAIEEGFRVAEELGVKLLMSGRRRFLEKDGALTFRNQPVNTKKFYCEKPWTSALIMTNGDVLNCCWQTRSVGSLKSASFGSIWQGETLREIRESTLKGIPHPVCLNPGNKCPYLGRN